MKLPPAAAFEMRGADVRMRKLYGSRTSVTWVLAISALLALAAVVASSVAVGLIGSLVFGLGLPLALFDGGTGGVRESADLSISEAGIEIVDARGVRDRVPRDAIREGFLHGESGSIRAHFRLRGGGSLEVVASDREEGERLLHAAGVTATNRTVSFVIVDDASYQFAIMAAAICGFPLGLRCFVHFANGPWRAYFDFPTGAIALFFALTVFPLLCAAVAALVRRAIVGAGSRLVVGRDGIAVCRSRMPTRFISYEHIAGVSQEKEALAIELANGETLRFPLMTSVAHPNALECVATHRDDAIRANEVASEIPALASVGRAPSEWLAALRSVATEQREGFREAPISREELWRVAESSAAPVQRLAAAIALRSAADEADRARLASIESGSADATFAARFRVAVESEEDAELEKLLEEEQERERSSNAEARAVVRSKS